MSLTALFAYALAIGIGQRARHAVECAGQLIQLVDRRGAHLHVEPAGGELLRRRGDIAQRTAQALREDDRQ